MPARSIAVLLVLFSVAALGQVRLPHDTKKMRPSIAPERIHLDHSASFPVAEQTATSDTIRLLALMVDFQTDASTMTSGNGHFLLDSTSAPNVIDPAPHDSSFFADKIQFLSNYFRKVSNSKVNLKGDVFGRVITLSKTMDQYSPAKDGSNDKPLGNLITEAWHLADSLYPGIQFSKYNAFVIFHAGVGRDVNLVAALGFDPTPYDIPSLTFNLASLRSYLGDPTFAGISVSRGSFRVTNTLLLPETETRTFLSGNTLDTLQESINGLLANSFGSYLGLPDLFDTKTGASGEGQFGLMDAASVFVFNGLFPPEPSAWEKVYLGWVTPLIVSAGTTTISLPAVGLKTGRDTVYKVPISDREYFLIENRSRDPYQNGQRLTIRQGKSIVTKFFARDTVGFGYGNVSLISGSVIDVEDYDWALPSLTSIDDTNYVGGGILIWHIDENVILSGLADNSVNADPSHRGIDLEEADGAQDIGQTYDPFVDPGAGTELGYEQDFWYQGNVVPIYRNVFDKDSQPNSRSYSGAASLVTIRDFSARSPRMTALVSLGSNLVQRLPGFSRSLPAQSAVTPPSAIGWTVLLGVDGKIFAYKPDGSSSTTDTSGLLYPKGGGFSPAVTGLRSTGMGQTNLLIAGVQDSTLYILNAIDRKAVGVFDSLGAVIVQTGDRLTTPAMFADLSVSPSIVVGSSHGTVWSYSYAGVLQKKTVVSSSPISSLTQLPTPSLSKPAELFFTSGSRVYGEQNSVSLGDSSLPWIAIGITNNGGNFVVAGQVGGRRVVGISRDLNRILFDVTINGGSISTLAAADIDGDGQKDVVVLAGDRICVLNRTGAFLSGFPVLAQEGATFVGDPIIGDLTGDGLPEIALCLTNGEFTAYDQSGRMKTGFPVQLTSGGAASVAALVNGSRGDIDIVGVTTVPTVQPAVRASGSGESLSGSACSMQAIEFPASELSRLSWTQYLKDWRHSNFDGSTAGTAPVSTEFLPKSRVYNWPNPAYGSTTQIRYYTPEDATISIKIFDLAGVKIAELSAQSKGGLDGEVPWDVSRVQSGVYLARIEATGSSRSEVAIIKIAIVK
jgi:hypothetical protein